MMKVTAFIGSARKQHTYHAAEQLLQQLQSFGHKLMLNEHFRDYAYYLHNGWFESDYYYPVQLNPFKKLIGRFFNVLATHLARHT